MLCSGKEIIDLLSAQSNPAIMDRMIDIQDICLDSRNAKKGDLFIALAGEKVDGHDYVKAAQEKGASFALVEKEIPNVDKSKLIIVKSTIEGLRKLAQYNVSKTSAKYVAVTGSIGKTTTKDLLHHLLSKSGTGKIYASKKNFNSQIGMPVCAALMPQDTKIGIFEMGMSEKGNLKRLTEIVRPNISIITQICESHLEFFNSVWDIAKAKSEIMETTPPQDAVIIPTDCAYTDFLKNKAKICGINSIYTFGFFKGDAYVKSYEQKNGVIVINAEILGQNIKYDVRCHNISIIPNSLSALMAAHLIENIPLDELAKSIDDFMPVEGRGCIFQKNDILIIDDSYNACATSMKSSIKSLCKYEGRKILVIGDMKELGKSSIHMHENLSATIDKFGIDMVFACGELAHYLFDNLQKKKQGYWCQNSYELGQEIVKFIKPGDRILVKGSHSMCMNKVIEEIKRVL